MRYTIILNSMLLSALIALVAILYYETHFENFNPLNDRVYRLKEAQYFNKPDSQNVALTMYPMGPTLFSRFSEIESFSRLQQLGEVAFENDEKHGYAYGILTDTAFFHLFGLPLVHADYNHRPLSQKGEAVVTQHFANEHFGTQRAVGKKIKMAQREFKIVGVVTDPPKNCHLQFDVLVSRVTIEKNIDAIDWTRNNFVTYLLFRPGANIDVVLRDMEAFEKANLEDPSLYNIYIQPVNEIHYDSQDLVHDPLNFYKIGPSAIPLMWIEIALVVLLISLFGVQVILVQTSTRNFFLAVKGYYKPFAFSFLLALFLSACLLLWLRIDVFANVFERGATVVFCVLILGSFVVPSLLTFLLSMVTHQWITESKVVQDNIVKVLTVFTSLTTSVFFCFTALCLYLVASRTISAFNKMPGTSGGIIEIPLTRVSGENLKPLQFALRKNPNIKSMATSVDLPMGTIHQKGIDFEGKDPSRRVVASMMTTDAKLLDFLKISFLHGRNFSSKMFLEKGNSYIINRSLADLIGWPIENCVGRPIGIQGDVSGTIIGVVEDFNFLPGYFISGPLILAYSDEPNTLLVKFSEGSEPAGLKEFENEWTKWNQEPVRFNDYNLRFVKQHEAQTFLLQILIPLSLLALGLVIIQFFQKRTPKEDDAEVKNGRWIMLILISGITAILTYIVIRLDLLVMNSVSNIRWVDIIALVFFVLLCYVLSAPRWTYQPIQLFYSKRSHLLGLVLASSAVLLLSCGGKSTSKPVSNYSYSNSVALGERLFFDPRLSFNKTVSCASCHKKEFAFSDNQSLSLGFDTTPTKRNTPSILYMAGRKSFFWDGRSSSLEHQATFPITDQHEMGLPIAELISRLRSDTTYQQLFLKAFNQLPDSASVSRSLADYQRTLTYRSSLYDHYLREQDSSKMSPSVLRGMRLFFGKARCDQCHKGADFSDDEFRNIGILNGDHGRFEITKVKEDKNRFKTPTLRNVSLTAPYMHDGSLSTLRDVLEFYNSPGEQIKKEENIDELMLTPLGLTVAELEDIENFLIALTDTEFKKIAANKSK